MEIKDLIVEETKNNTLKGNLIFEGKINFNDVNCYTFIFENKKNNLYSIYYFYFSNGKGWSLYGSKENIKLAQIFKTISE